MLSIVVEARRIPGVGASSRSTMVEKRFVGGRLRSCALSSPVRTRRRGEEDFGGEDGLGSGGDASAIIVFCFVPFRGIVRR
jgi:hypothetical protein